MAYAVVDSLKQTLFGLAINDFGHISLAKNSSLQILGSLYEELISLQKVLVKLNKSCRISKSSSRSRSINRETVNALDGQIRYALCELEDILDFHVSDQTHSQIPPGDDDMNIHHPLLFTIDLEQLTQNNLFPLSKR